MDHKTLFAPRPLITEDLKEPRKDVAFYSIGQVAKKLNISEYQLKKLEDQGHIRPRMRTPGGHRRYAEDQLPDILKIATRRKIRPVRKRKPGTQATVNIDKDLYERIKERCKDQNINKSIGRYISEILRQHLETDKVRVEVLISSDAHEGLLSQGKDLGSTIDKVGQMMKKKKSEN